MNLCKCGCGSEVNLNYKKGHGRRGKFNSETHNLAISRANSGKKMSESTKLKLISCHKGKRWSAERKLSLSILAKESGFGKWMSGKKLSNVTKEKLSNIHKGHLVSHDTRKKIGFANSGEKNGMFGRRHTDIERLKISEASRAMYADIEFRKKMRIYWESDEFKKHCRKAALTTAMKLLYSKYTDTKPELEMKSILGELRVDYIHPFPVWDIEHCFAADFFIPDGKIIIEVDGLFWHDFPNGLEVDKLRNDEMKKKGYVVLRFWESKFNIEDVYFALKDHLSEFPDYYTRLKRMEEGRCR